MKRTTLILEDACLEGVRELAHARHETMSDVVNSLLAKGLIDASQRCPADTFHLASFPMGRAKVDLTDRDALASVME